MHSLWVRPMSTCFNFDMARLRSRLVTFPSFSYLQCATANAAVFRLPRHASAVSTDTLSLQDASTLVSSRSPSRTCLSTSATSVSPISCLI
ncbi:hypothetical protein B0H12DRAFT_171015 [Mycena haematopus]|nr:hypothetical protein B0H12DRAFT_171015 [Mycena haematopus]